MAVNGDSYGYFWDSSDGDRKYSSNSFAKVFNQFFTTGVFNGNFGITANGGMEIKCSGGYANIQGRIGYFDETLFTLEAAHSTYPRRDAIVVACDYVNRKITLRVEQGQYSSTNAPRYYPTRSDEVYELVVGYVYVGAGVTEITTANIEDYRFSKVSCGIVTGTVEEINVEQLTTKLEYNFTQWFLHIKGQLSTDAAGKLQNEIDGLVDNLNASQIDYSNTNSGLESIKIQGAIDEVAERIATVEPIVSRNDNQLTANNKPIYLDYHDGKYGYNTDPNRGADTFNPFSNGVGGGSIFIGTYTTTTTVDVSAFEAESISEFLAVCPMAKGESAGMTWVTSDNVSASGSYTPPSISLSNGVITITPAKLYAHAYGANHVQFNIPTYLYYVGENFTNTVYDALDAVGATPESKSVNDVTNAIKNKAKGFQNATFSWYGVYDKNTSHGTVYFDRPINIKVSCSSSIGSVNVATSNGSAWIASGSSTTFTNTTYVTVGDGNYPEGYAGGNATITVTRV